MANSLSNVIPRLLAQALPVLREQLGLPRLVNRSYDQDAAQQGASIDIPVGTDIAVQDVVPNNVPPNTADFAPGLVTLTLDRWKEAPFQMSDKDRLEVMNGVIPAEAKTAVSALARHINQDILAEYVNFYGFAGTPGVTPFSAGTGDATAINKILNVQLAPTEERRFVLDPEAEANALGQRAFQDQSWRIGLNEAAIVRGQISRTLGFDFYGNQLTPVHTAGTLTGTITVGADAALGATTVQLNTDGGEAIALKKGDIVTFAGQGQTYVVKANLTVGASSNGNLTIAPGLKAAITAASNTAISVKGSHTVNLAFQKDAIAFASRPLDKDLDGMGRMQSVVDPISGIALRLEVTREHKRTRWSFDILYGIKTIRPEFGARLAG